MSVKATDASGIARVELLINGKVVATDTRAGYVLAFKTTSQKKTIKVQVRAYDKLGNVKYTTTRTWTRS
ncbi:Ig-like domain-containing protein [Actinoplanes sp. NPDC026623]|uniref:Ig-like domain-containing protein n=1 Tax=Actinoplanes sp. NPDC026623 TaxID=3155610 RepID=UPI00340161B5